MKKVLVVGFACGVIAVFTFHQALAYALFHQFPFIKGFSGIGDSFRPPSRGFNWRPGPPAGLPVVVWMALLGGLWAIVLGMLIRFARLPDLLTGAIFGAVVVTAFDLSLGAQMRGQAMWANGDQLVWWRFALLNTAWGWGTAFLMRPFALSGR